MEKKRDSMRGEGETEEEEFRAKGDEIFVGKGGKKISLFLYILSQLPIRLMQ